MKALNQFLHSIGYPASASQDVREFILNVDGNEMRAADAGAYLVLMKEISRSADILPQLSRFAVGRFICEDEILYWDASLMAAVLSRKIPVTASDCEMRDAFEAFANSCDWWDARVNGSAVAPAISPEMVILP